MKQQSISPSLPTSTDPASRGEESMEDRLISLKSHFDGLDRTFADQIEPVLEQCLSIFKAEFTPFYKQVLPVCAAFYLILEQREKLKAQSVNGTDPNNPSKSLSSLQTTIPSTRLIGLMQQFKCKGVDVDDPIELDEAIECMIDFAAHVRNREFSERIQSYLVNVVALNYRLYQKLASAIDSCFTPQIATKMMVCLWRLFRCLSVMNSNSNNHTYFDVETNSYLLLFVSAHAIMASKNQLQAESPSRAIVSDNLASVRQQLNATIFSGRLELLANDGLSKKFSELLAQVQEKLSLESQVLSYFATEDGISKLNTVLKNASSSLDIEDTDFIDAEEQSHSKQDKQSNPVVRRASIKSSRIVATVMPQTIEKENDIHEHVNSTNNNHVATTTTTTTKAVRKLSAHSFNDDVASLQLNSKLSDFGKGTVVSSPGIVRLLNYGWNPRTPTQPDHQQHQQHFKIPQQSHRNTPMHPSSSSAVLTQPPSTPYSTALDKFKWINAHSKAEKTDKIDAIMQRISADYKQTIIASIREISTEVFTAGKGLTALLAETTSVDSQTGIQNELNNKILKATCFFFNVLEKMVNDDETRMQRQDYLVSVFGNRLFIYSVFGMCMLTFCFVREIKGIGLDALIVKCGITAFDLWRAISTFAKFDRQMPESIRERLFNLEKTLLLYNVWEDADVPAMLVALSHFRDENSSEIQNYQRVACRRLNSHSATRVKEICKVLELNEAVQESVWDSLLQVMRCHVSLLKKRNVDQFIICSIYALKLIKGDIFEGKEMKFKNIFIGCEKLSDFDAKKVKKVFVATTDANSEDSVDIITFYNKIFLPPMKAYYKQKGSQLKSSDSDNTTFQSVQPLQQQQQHSLNDSIPTNFLHYIPVLKDVLLKNIHAPMTPMTPMSSQLIAMGETFDSPRLFGGQHWQQQLQILRFKQNQKRAGVATGEIHAAASALAAVQQNEEQADRITFNVLASSQNENSNLSNKQNDNNSDSSNQNYDDDYDDDDDDEEQEASGNQKNEDNIIEQEDSIQQKQQQHQQQKQQSGRSEHSIECDNPDDDEEDSRSRSQVMDLFGHQMKIASVGIVDKRIISSNCTSSSGVHGIIRQPHKFQQTVLRAGLNKPRFTTEGDEKEDDD